MASTVISAPFRVGRKELYLPKFILTLLRTDYLPANQAKFLVPLWFSKLDLRDYLYHAYGVRIHSVASYVKQQRARFGPAKPKTPMNRRWHRPRAKKYMTVQLEQPFVWPEEPEDMDPWGKKDIEAQEKDVKGQEERMGATADTLVNEERRTKMKEQAKALLEGKEKWKPTTRRSLGQMLTRYERA